MLMRDLHECCMYHVQHQVMLVATCEISFIFSPPGTQSVHCAVAGAQEENLRGL